MKKSQLAAIRYSYAEKARKANEQALNERGLTAVFMYQKTYKTLNGFLKADEKQLTKCIAEALKNVEARIKQLELSNCTSYKYDEALEAYEEIKQLIQ